MAGITASGLGSGIDIKSLASQLVAAERGPATSRLDSRESKLKAQISAFGSFKSVLANLQSSLTSLKKIDTFQSLKATVADDALLTATASNGAQLGEYAIKVEQLAQAQRLATAADHPFASPSTTVGAGVLTFEFGTVDSAAGTFTANASKTAKTVTIDPTNNTLAGVRDAINKANIGVTASVVNDGNGYRLVIGAKDSGAANSLKITVNDGDGTHDDPSGLSLLAYDPVGTGGKNLTETVAARNARINLDGLTVTSASNTLQDAVPGVTLNLKTQGETATRLTVAEDASVTTKALETFVNSYNDMMKTTKSLTAYNKDTKTAGTLAGDQNVRSTLNRIRDIFTSSVTGTAGAYRSLADAGISLQSDGTLKLDSSKLKTALSADPQSVASLFTRAGTTTDPLVSYTGATSASKPGQYDLAISQLPAQGRYVGSVTPPTGSLVIGDTGNTFALKVNGVQSGAISLAAGTYTSAQLSATLQSQINGDPALQAAGALISASVGANGFSLTSAQYGSSSSIEFTAVGTTIQGALGFAIGAGTTGRDVQGTLDGAVASGSGRKLTGTTGDATGLAVDILGGATGARGKVSLSDGIAQRLDTLLGDTLGGEGPLQTRTESLSRQIDQIGDERDRLDVRMSALEARYKTQFASMDKLVSRLTSTGSYLTQQLASLSGN